jgi:hypothetical protein
MTPFRSSCRVGLAGLAVAATIAVVACKTDYQQGLEDPRYGGPNALAGQKQPGPSVGGDNAGGPGGSSPVLCIKQGNQPADGGTCTVSLKNDILPAFKAAGCNQQGSCHGGVTPPNEPKIDPDDSASTWADWAAFPLSNGKFYIDPCSTDPTKSGLAANVNAAASATDRGTLMPLGSTTGLSTDVIAKLETWLKCASPNN